MKTREAHPSESAAQTLNQSKDMIGQGLLGSLTSLQVGTLTSDGNELLPQDCETPKKLSKHQKMRVEEELIAGDSDDDIDEQSEESSDNAENEEALLASVEEKRESAPKVVEDDKQEEEPEEDETKGMDGFQLARYKRRKEEEMKKMKQFCDENGFNIDNMVQQERFDRLEALEKFEPTKEWLEEKRKKNIMENLVPPPLAIMTRRYENKEPVRTGFNQGLLNVDIRNNFEAARCAQGPQVIVQSSALKRRETSKEPVKPPARSQSRENSMTRDAKDPLRTSTTLNSARKGDAVEPEADEGLDQKVHIVQQQQNYETSLRHLFYLEYKTKFPEGERNPIVYSRFGKSHYSSEEKFDNANFNQLIRTCNLKKLLKAQEQADKPVMNRMGVPVKKPVANFNMPMSFPSCDYYKPRGDADKTLVFESRFESGNLQLVNKQSDLEYDLVLQNDVNSKGHTQWFYFRVTNTRKNLKVKFNMLNMIKSKSLYNDGMKVLIHSGKRQDASEEAKYIPEEEREAMKGWYRGGEDMAYFQNHYKKENGQNQLPNFQQRTYYSFSFSHTFEHDHDTVYFAYSLPYTYTQLTDYLCQIQTKQLPYVTRNTLCRTIAGNKCEYLTITNRMPFEQDKKKRGVVITSRIHPGETNSSWMMKGVIDFLTSADPEAHELRNNYVFKIIPMMNPDGVINGNYRCSLAGCDLNRRWKFPSEMLHPTVFHTKKLLS